MPFNQAFEAYRSKAALGNMANKKDDETQRLPSATKMTPLVCCEKKLQVQLNTQMNFSSIYIYRNVQ